MAIRRTALILLFVLLLALPPTHCINSNPETYFDGSDNEEYLNWWSAKGAEYYQRSYFLQSTQGGSGAAVHWRIDGDHFRVAIAARATGWVAFGISENGGMRGADVVTFDGSNLVDAHILGDLAAPIPDECQSWTLHDSYTEGGFIIFQASRLLDTGDGQDRVLVDDSDMTSPTRIIAAWGDDSSTVQYHGPHNRARNAIYLFQGQDVGDQLEAFHAEMEAEAEGSIVIRAHNFTVPETETEYVYFCFSYDYLVRQGMPPGSAKHIIGMEAEVDNVKYVHHMAIAGNPYDKWDDAKNCANYQRMEALYLWAPGTDPYSLPKEAGFALDQGNGYLSFELEIHYNNPTHDKGQLDSTGIRLYYTSTKRPHDMGVLNTGDPLIALEGTPIGNGLTMHQFDCPSTCSAVVLQQEIVITKSYLHMHRKGTAMQNEIIRDGQVIHTSKVDYFDFDQQGQFAVLGDEITMKAGDSVRTRCYYDSNEDTEFGLASAQEMCIFNGYYYPRQFALSIIPFVCLIDNVIGIDYGCLSNYTKTAQLESPNEVGRGFGISPSTCPAIDTTHESEDFEEDESADESQVSSCFSGDMVVETKDYGKILMKKLELGMEIRVDADNDTYERVYSFGHYAPKARAEFLQFQPSGLEVTPNHLVFVNNRAVPASAVKLGDVLNSGESVTSIKNVTRRGFYAPFTQSGKLLVNDVQASSYIAFHADSDVFLIGGYRTPWTYQWLAHSFQLPHRTYCRYIGDCFEEKYTSNGLSLWIARPFEFFQWLLAQHSAFVGLVMATCVLVLASLTFALESGCKLLLLAVLTIGSFKMIRMVAERRTTFKLIARSG